MSAQQWLIYLALTALLGACGQMARTVAGLRKLHESMVPGPQEPRSSDQQSSGLDLQRMLISLSLGGVAGVLAGIGLWKPEMVGLPIERGFLLAVVASGYAGSDFIEAFIQKAISK